MTDQAPPHAATFHAAAAWLTGARAAPAAEPEVQALLRFLDPAGADPNAAEPLARLLHAAAKFRRVFQLPVPDAPGLIFCGAEADPGCLGAQYSGLPPASLAGSGLTPRRAFEACAGEGIEYLSQFVRPTDDIATGTLTERGGTLDEAARRFVAQVLATGGVDPSRPIDWARLHRVADGSEAWFPVDLCLRRAEALRDFTPPLRLSSGCAAGVTEADAALRAVLELVERDAAALWWRGGRRGRAIAPDGEAGRAAADLLEQSRQGSQERRTWLLDITTDLAIPAIAAISARPDGFGFAFGLAARLDAAAAARAAIFEMCQGELAYHVVAAKRREAGDARLNENDHRRLRHGTEIDTRRCQLLEPMGDSALTPAAAADAATGMRVVLERLERAGIAAYRMVLTRPEFQVPVVRIAAPGLQAEPCPIIGERLARAMADTGGGGVHTAGLPLF